MSFIQTHKAEMSSILENSQNEVLHSAEKLKQICVFSGPGESRPAEESHAGPQGIHRHGECPLCSQAWGFPANESSGERQDLNTFCCWHSSVEISVAKVWLWSDSALWPQTESSLAGVLCVPCAWPKGENQILKELHFLLLVLLINANVAQGALKPEGLHGQEL